MKDEWRRFPSARSNPRMRGDPQPSRLKQLQDSNPLGAWRVSIGGQREYFRDFLTAWRFATYHAELVEPGATVKVDETSGRFGKPIYYRFKHRQMRSNPSLRSEVARAKKLGQAFSGHRQNRSLIVRRAGAGRVRLAIGPVTGIMYLAKRDGRIEQYLHRFREGSRPLLATNQDGSRLELLGGAFRFTERGIVDNPVTVRRPRKKRSA